MAGKKAPSFPFFVSYGAEEYFLDVDIEKAKVKWRDRSITVLDGEVLSGEDIVSICETRTFDDTPRLIVLDNANKVKADKHLKAYVGEKDVEDLRVILVIVYRGDTLPDVWSAAGKKGRVIEHKKLKTWDNNNEVLKWIPKEADDLGIMLDKEVSESIYKCLGSDLRKISNELKKLSILVGSGGLVTQKILKEVIVPIMPVEPYQVADAVGRKECKTALNTLSSLYKSMGEDAAIVVVSSLMRLIEKLTVARYMVDNGVSEEELPGRLDMHPYRFRTHFNPMVKRFTLQELLSAMGKICKLDADVKGSSRSKRTLLELTIISIIQ